ncbi:MAG: alkaline phosphatase [Propionibacteriales bacterium]|nr:alkaline phosphatase [Propionibacteriales bacterium]
MRVSNAVVADPSIDRFLGLGDFQYDCDDPGDYPVSYDPSWGRIAAIMSPVPGNHEYKATTDEFGAACPTTNTTAQSYFTYFGAAAHPETKGHYSFDLGSWHLIGLNGNCSKSGVGGCAATSAQTTWLNNDLAATTQPCIAAFWHQPLFTASTVSGPAYRPWWNALYAARADVVLNSHLHNYQRYAPMNPSGGADPANGITEYVVGTGGVGFAPVNTTVLPQPVAWRKSFGYLRLTLRPTGWDSQFIDPSGTVLDSATGDCHLT